MICTWLKHMTLRKLKKIVFLVIGLLCLLLWYSSRRGQPLTSAIKCKSKIAQIVFPNPQDRHVYLSNMDTNPHVIETDYFNLMSQLQVQCYDQEHMGARGDGGWEVCMDRKYVITKPCLVYSFGVGDSFEFEHDFEKKLGCEIHAFDPSIGLSSYQYSENGYFHDYGIDSADVMVIGLQWKLKKFSTIVKQLKHEERQIDYLKLDVEFSEWPALYDMISSGSINMVRQIALELHSPEMDVHTRPDHECTQSTVESVQFMLKIVLELQRVGFRTYYSSTNYRTSYISQLTGEERYCCHNLHMVNTKMKEL